MLIAVTPTRVRSCAKAVVAENSENIKQLQGQVQSMVDTLTALRLQEKDQQVAALLEANQELMRQLAEALAFGPVI